MSDEVYILRKREVTEQDKNVIKYSKKDLLPCPVCGAKAYMSKDIVNGFYFGWSVGCPRFCLNDGIHGIDQNSPKNKFLSFHGLNSATECVVMWNKRVQEYNNG